jgi:ribosomal 50S subunit-recycling heat shock protein
MFKKMFLLILLISILIIFVFSCKNKDSGDAVFQAIIHQYTGKVTINDREAKAGAFIKSGDVIKTDGNSSCVILVKNKNVFKLHSKTTVVFSVNKNKSEINVSSGIFGGLSREKFGENNLFNINTPTAIAGIRGTAFYIKVENSLSTYFCVCNGIIDIKGINADNKETVEAKEHNLRHIVKLNTGETKIGKDTGVKYHGNEDIEELAKIINVQIDWTKVHGGNRY